MAWWTQLKVKHTCLGKPKIMVWDKLKVKLRKIFLPYNYDQLMFQRLQNLRKGSHSVEEHCTDFFFFLLVFIFTTRIIKYWLVLLVVFDNKFSILSICLICSQSLKHINKLSPSNLKLKATFLLGVRQDLHALPHLPLYHQ